MIGVILNVKELSQPGSILKNSLLQYLILPISLQAFHRILQNLT